MSRESEDYNVDLRGIAVNKWADHEPTPEDRWSVHGLTHLYGFCNCDRLPEQYRWKSASDYLRR